MSKIMYGLSQVHRYLQECILVDGRKGTLKNDSNIVKHWFHNSDMASSLKVVTTLAPGSTTFGRYPTFD